tara:strand:- start:273 stop:449 length:177 start_codon:yes stop_codon:yes gene_type:complete
MGFVGDALLESANLFRLNSETGVFLGFVFLTVFCGFASLVIAYAINGKNDQNIAKLMN